MKTAFEIARAAGEEFNQAKIAVQVRQNEIRAAKIEAANVFSLAQAGPLVEGAAEARQQLAEIEGQLPEKTGGLDLLQAEEFQRQAEARAAGLGLLDETEALMDEIAAILRGDVLPLADRLNEHTKVLQACRCPLPGQRQGRHDPYQAIPLLLLRMRQALRDLDERRR